MKIKTLIIRLLAFLIIFFSMDFMISKILEKGIDTFYGLDSHSQILLAGHSELMLAVDKVLMEEKLGCKISKYTREGVNVADRLTMIKQYFDLACSDSVKTVLYGVDQFIFTGEGLSSNSYKLFYPFMDNKIIDKYVEQNAENEYDYWSHKIVRTSRYTDLLVNAAFRGFTHNWDNFKTGSVNINQLKADLKENTERHIKFEEENIKLFKETLDFLQQKNVRVFLINTPMVDLLNEAEPEKYAQILSMFRHFELQYTNTVFLDFNPEFSSDYSLFFDYIHLNKKGQELVTDAIIRELKSAYRVDNIIKE